MNNVLKTVNSHLCNGCGMCEVVCPHKVIQVNFDHVHGHFVPAIDEAECVNCGICLKTCNGWNVDHQKLQIENFGSLSKDPFLGHYEKVFIASSSIKNISQNGASGGCVTQLLINLLEQNVIDAAVIVNSDDYKNPSGYITSNIEELKNYQRSWYFNVPICKILREVLDKKLKVAMVLLPCHLHSILKSYEYFPELKELIILKIGLLCGGSYKTNALNRQLSQLKIHDKEIQKIDFRYGDWPGKMRILLKNGKEIFSRRSLFFNTNYLDRCYFCYDFLNEFADISVGDNWLKKQGKGENIIVIRNNRFTEYFDNILLKEIESTLLYKAYKLKQRRQKYFVANRFIAKLFRKNIPDLKIDKRIKPKPKHYFLSFFEFLQFKMGNRNLFLIITFFKIKGVFKSIFLAEKLLHENHCDQRNPVIFISEVDVVGNKGAIAMLHCIINEIRKRKPETEFVILSKKAMKSEEFPDVKIVPEREQEFDLALISLWIWWLFSKIGLYFNFLLKNDIIEKYRNADLILSASGISFIDDFGIIKLYHYSKYLQIPLLLKKKIIKFTQSLGPFNSVVNRSFAKSILPNLNFIIARGENSFLNLNKIGIKKNVRSLPDIAITLKSKKSKQAIHCLTKLESYNIIGISPNIVCSTLDKKKLYIKTLIELCDHISRKYPENKILLIPHSFDNEIGKRDDFSICREILKKVNDPKNIILENTFNYSPEETKWLISQCQFFVGSRFHSIIAAVSSFVPTITIGWHWKYEETMKWLGLKDNLIYYWELDKKNFIELFEDNYQKRTETRQTLKTVIPKLQENALVAIDKIIEELEK